MSKYKNQSELIVQVMKNIPYPDQVNDLDLSFDNVVRFTWRGDRFRFNAHGGVEMVDDGFLVGTNTAILPEKILNQ